MASGVLREEEVGLLCCVGEKVMTEGGAYT